MNQTFIDDEEMCTMVHKISEGEHNMTNEDKLASLIARFEEARAEVDGRDLSYPGIIWRIGQAEKALDAVRKGEIK